MPRVSANALINPIPSFVFLLLSFVLIRNGPRYYPALRPVNCRYCPYRLAGCACTFEVTKFTMKKTVAKSIDGYIEQFPAATQKALKQVYKVIQKAAPGAKESISYAMPTFKVNGSPLVYFGGYDHHVGFYPAPVGISQFSKELSGYKQGKGSVQFPLDEPMPLELISKIVKYRLKQLEEKTKSKSKSKNQKK